MFLSAVSIERALDSVVEQGREDVETLCIDDGSPDSSAEIVLRRAEADPCIRLLRLERNSGQGVARNTGLDAARGDYIVFLDADDTLLPGSLDQIAKAVQSLPDVVFIGCEEEKRGRLSAMPGGELLSSIARDGRWRVGDHPEVLFFAPSPWSKVYRREFLNRHSLRFPGGVFEDIPWSALTTVLAESIAAVPSSCYRYVTGESGSSTTTTRHERNLVRVEQVRRIREGCDIEQLPRSVQAALGALAAIHLIWANRAAYRTLPEGAEVHFFRESAEELRWWSDHVPPLGRLSTSVLMADKDREFFARALLTGSFERWTRALATHAKRRRFRRLFGGK